MQVRILDLDGSVRRLAGLAARLHPDVLPAQAWGPWIRMACSFGRFRRFEQALAAWTGGPDDAGPTLTFCGSGDFHHVSLALVRRVRTPVNLVVLDNHPDWMRGVPFMHCGTWLYHAAQLPHVERIYHIGGDVDFDNYYQWMAPWQMLRSGKIVVLPSRRRFERGSWGKVANEPLRLPGQASVEPERIRQLLEPYRLDLASRPLYISLDKDVMTSTDALVNWDSGHLALDDVLHILNALVDGADGEVAAMDVVGDWSPVEQRGLLGRFMHWTEHPALEIDSADATRRNQRTNLAIIDGVRDLVKSFGCTTSGHAHR
jgi:hypothetical protein